MAKEKEGIIVAKEIDRIGFIEDITSQINMMDRAIKDIEEQIRTFQDLYLKVIRDEINYNLKFYIIGDEIRYERKGRKRIGF